MQSDFSKMEKCFFVMCLISVKLKTIESFGIIFLSSFLFGTFLFVYNSIHDITIWYNNKKT